MLPLSTAGGDSVRVGRVKLVAIAAAAAVLTLAGSATPAGRVVRVN